MTGNEVTTLLSGVVSGLVISILVFGAWIVKKLGQHDSALAVILQQLNPPGSKSLRDLMIEIKIEQARIQGQVTPTDMQHGNT